MYIQVHITLFQGLLYECSNLVLLGTSSHKIDISINLLKMWRLLKSFILPWFQLSIMLIALKADKYSPVTGKPWSLKDNMPQSWSMIRDLEPAPSSTHTRLSSSSATVRQTIALSPQSCVREKSLAYKEDRRFRTLSFWSRSLLRLFICSNKLARSWPGLLETA